jgi:hypothetical protein
MVAALPMLAHRRSATYRAVVPETDDSTGTRRRMDLGRDFLNRMLLLLCLLLMPVGAVPVLADSIPYAHAGTIAMQVPTYASTNGITAYYMGSSAGNEDQIDVYDVQTGYDSGLIFDNKKTSTGSSPAVGTQAGQINAGDQLIFYIDSPDGHFASVAIYSADGINHAYITAFSGATVNNQWVPAGLFVGMEDLPNGQSDLNYNDDDLVFAGVSQSSVSTTPEPASIALLATGIIGVLWLRRRPAA